MQKCSQLLTNGTTENTGNVEDSAYKDFSVFVFLSYLSYFSICYTLGLYNTKITKSKRLNKYKNYQS